MREASRQVESCCSNESPNKDGRRARRRRPPVSVSGWALLTRVAVGTGRCSPCSRKREGLDLLQAAIADLSRLCYVDVLADERSEAAATFLKRAVEWFALQNVSIERVMTDNGSAF